MGAQSPDDTGLSDNTPVLQELSPPQRPGRRGGIYVTGATPTPSSNDFSRTLSRIVQSAATNPGSSTEGAPTVVVVTNHVVRTINPVDVPAGILYPAVLPAPVPPGNESASSAGANGVNSTPESDLGGGTISVPPGPVTLPPQPATVPPGTIGIPPGPAGIPPPITPSGTISGSSPPGVPPPIVSPPSPTGSRSR